LSLKEIDGLRKDEVSVRFAMVWVSADTVGWVTLYCKTPEPVIPTSSLSKQMKEESRG